MIGRQWCWLVILPCVMLLLSGCSGTKETASQAPPAQAPPSVPDALHEAAVRHFIEGSVNESKGEYAQAALEYQEALRYEKDHAIYFALGKCYAALNKPSLAIESIKEAVRLSPRTLEYKRLLADVQAGAFDFEGAVASYNDVIRQDSSSIESWYNLARIEQGRRPLKALELYEAMVARFGDQWDVLLQMAEIANKLGRFDRAADALERMTNLDPGNTALRHTLAQTLVRAGRADSALAVYGEILESDSTDLAARAESAGIWLGKKEYGRAGKLFGEILAQDSVTVDVKLHIGQMYFEQAGKDSTLIPAARKIFEGIRDEAKDDWRPYWFLGAIAAQQKDDAGAASNFTRVTKLAPQNSDAWVLLSEIFLQKNDFAGALPVLEAAVRVVPDDYRVNFFLGICYGRTNRNPDAARVLERAHELNPKDVDIIGQLAMTYDALGNHDESDSLYEQGLRLDAKNHLLLNNYAYSLSERGISLERARRMASTALEVQPDNSSYLDTMGWIYYQLGEYAKAETYVAKAVANGEASAVVLEHLGDIYEKLDDPVRALEQWKMALGKDASNSGLKEKIARRSR
jgi:tetratricopeptide (TPR) repeat protein